MRAMAQSGSSPERSGANSQPREITAGPDGNIWFTELMGNRIGRLIP